LIGAIAGDIIGSVYEFGRTKSKEFPLFGPDSCFTDDTVMTVAIAQAVLTDGDYRKAVLDFGRRYPDVGYGGFFNSWLRSSDPKPYNSWGTVPEAIIAFLESTSYEDAVRNAVSLGGDSDTLACITGGIAEAFYGPVSPSIRQKVEEILTPELWEITEAFCAKFGL
jgi:ADP-ribosylglycohydrolase